VDWARYLCGVCSALCWLAKTDWRVFGLVLRCQRNVLSSHHIVIVAIYSGLTILTALFAAKAKRWPWVLLMGRWYISGTSLIGATVDYCGSGTQHLPREKLRDHLVWSLVYSSADSNWLRLSGLGLDLQADSPSVAGCPCAFCHRSCDRAAAFHDRIFGKPKRPVFSACWGIVCSSLAVWALSACAVSGVYCRGNLCAASLANV